MSIQLVQDDLDSANEALDQLRIIGTDPHTDQMDDLRKHFRTVLIYSNRVFTKLEQLTKTPALQPWFGYKKRERKDDPLLSYMHHARNADEHTIVEVIAQEGGVLSLTIYDDTPAGALIGQLDSDSKGQIIIHPGPDTQVTSYDPITVRLKPAVDRGVTYPVPETHLGADILPPVPLTYAELFVKYLDVLVAEARGLI